jgi:hypothetical protein
MNFACWWRALTASMSHPSEVTRMTRHGGVMSIIRGEIPLASRYKYEQGRNGRTRVEAGEQG